MLDFADFKEWLNLPAVSFVHCGGPKNVSALYFLADGKKLQYVGCTKYLWNRISDHRRSGRFSNVDTVHYMLLTGFTPAEAKKLEAEAIWFFKPKKNKQSRL